MKIGIDASKLPAKKKTGVEITTSHIIMNLQKIHEENLESDDTFILYTNEPLDKKQIISKKFIERNIPCKKFWHKIRLPLALLKDRPDKFLELSSGIPYFAPKKSYILIHDLAFKIYPGAYSKYELFIQEKAILSAIKKAKKIIFTSESNRDDFYKFYNFPKKDTAIIPLAYNDEIYDNKLITKNKSVLNDPYFLFVGRLEKRKNILRVVRAFKIFKEKSMNNTKLVLVGYPSYGFSEANEYIKSNEILKNNVFLAGYKNDEDLAHLYSNAIALVFPSLYEGFGIPVLEAMATGTPVITSNINVLKEVSGGAAIIVDPQKEDDIVNAMISISTDNKKRDELIKKGIIRAKQFSWKKTAKMFYDLIQKNYD